VKFCKPPRFVGLIFVEFYKSNITIIRGLNIIGYSRRMGKARNKINKDLRDVEIRN
jgi:hypothetical protein